MQSANNFLEIPIKSNKDQLILLNIRTVPILGIWILVVLLVMMVSFLSNKNSLFTYQARHKMNLQIFMINNKRPLYRTSLILIM